METQSNPVKPGKTHSNEIILGEAIIFDVGNAANAGQNSVKLGK